MKSSTFSQKNLALLYIIAGSIAFFFAFAIAIQKIELLMNADKILPCNVNIFISCGTVIKSWQASLFGFPNPFLGIAGFSIITTIGFAMLSDFQPKKWFWVALSAGLFLATVFVYWLFHQAVFSIGALCPYCMVVWACTLPLFVFTLIRTLKEYGIKVKNWQAHLMLFSMYLVIIMGILGRFWDYLTLLF